MAITDALLPEFDREMGTTRKLLERLPDNLSGWKPHEKSMSITRLATHLAELPSWGSRMIEADELNITGGYTPNEEKSTAAILELFDKNVAQARRIIAGKTDAELMGPWTLKREGKPLFTLPKAAVLRSMLMNHMIHHRGQLSVYLRLNNIPLPPIYGPTADEGSF